MDNVGQNTSIQLRLDYNERNQLTQCPFCGGDDIELENTHTPSYWMECQNPDCQAQVHGAYGSQLEGKISEMKRHRYSAESALLRWNTRSEVSNGR